MRASSLALGQTLSSLQDHSSGALQSVIWSGRLKQVEWLAQYANVQCGGLREGGKLMYAAAATWEWTCLV